MVSRLRIGIIDLVLILFLCLTGFVVMTARTQQAQDDMPGLPLLVGGDQPLRQVQKGAIYISDQRNLLVTSVLLRNNPLVLNLRRNSTPIDLIWKAGAGRRLLPCTVPQITTVAANESAPHMARLRKIVCK
jgi:hypothetical protein